MGFILGDSFGAQLGTSVVFCFAFQGLRTVADPLLSKLAKVLGANNRIEQSKFAMQTINCFFHGVSGIWLTKTISRLGWKENPERLWGLTRTGEVDENAYHLLYCMEFGYHLQRLMSLFIHPKKKDFVEMLGHHLVTVFLLASSVHWGYIRIGMCVLAVHDVSDILGCLCKMASSCNWKNTLIGVFVPTCGMWFYTRLWLMPMHIIPAATLCPGSKFSIAISIAALSSLVALNGYWFAIFMKMLYRAIASKGKVAEDIQEDRPEDKGPEEQTRRKFFPSPASPCTGEGSM